MQYGKTRLLTNILGAVALLASMAGSAWAAAPNARIVVAKAGGSYTTITAALNAIIPTDAKRYTIEIWPGTYAENVIMKSYVTLQGMDRETTIIKPASGHAISNPTGVALTDVAISNLTVSVTGSSTWDSGVMFRPAGGSLRHSNITVQDLMITGAGVDSAIEVDHTDNAMITGNKIVNTASTGIWVWNTTGIISNNLIKGLTATCGHDCDFGITIDNPNDGSNVLTVTGNLITGNAADGIGIYYNAQNVTISNNTITNNSLAGIRHSGTNGVITGNRITGNGLTDTDISFRSADRGVGANISFNVYDDINGTQASGDYNVNSAGFPMPAP